MAELSVRAAGANLLAAIAKLLAIATRMTFLVVTSSDLLDGFSGRNFRQVL
jgi:hypothetical protein